MGSRLILPDDIGQRVTWEGLTGLYDAAEIDPPWRFKSNSIYKPGRNAMRYYDCMTLKQIETLPVGDLLAPNAAVFLWITGPFLVQGAHLPLLKAWRLKPSAIAFTWIKLRRKAATLFMVHEDLHMGTGFTTRKNAEFCLLCTRGRSIRQNRAVHEVIISPLREHSRKPDEFHQRVRQYVGPDAKICELFARESRPGIDGWGNELNKFVAAV